MSWVMDLESTVYTIIKTKFPERLTTKYPNIYFTNISQSNIEPQFPTVYIHMLPMVEQGSDLVNETINGVLATIQVDVTSNVSTSDVREVTTAILDIVKELRFQVTSMPEMFVDDDVYRQTFQSRRVIGSGDKL